MKNGILHIYIEELNAGIEEVNLQANAKKLIEKLHVTSVRIDYSLSLQDNDLSMYFI